MSILAQTAQRVQPLWLYQAAPCKALFTFSKENGCAVKNFQAILQFIITLKAAFWLLCFYLECVYNMEKYLWGIILIGTIKTYCTIKQVLRGQ